MFWACSIKTQQEKNYLTVNITIHLFFYIWLFMFFGRKPFEERKVPIQDIKVPTPWPNPGLLKKRAV